MTINKDNLLSMEDEIIASAQARLQPQTLTLPSGKIAYLNLSPDNIKQFSDITDKDHWSSVISPLAYAKQIDGSQFGVYRSTLKFPPFCPVCMKQATRAEIMESLMCGQTLSQKLRINASQETANRIFTALGYGRIWLVVFFCDQHGIKDKYVIAREFTQNVYDKYQWRMEIDFLNPEYGRLFKQSNDIPISWIKKLSLLFWGAELQFDDPADAESLTPEHWQKIKKNTFIKWGINAFLLILAAMSLVFFDKELAVSLFMIILIIFFISFVVSVVGFKSFDFRKETKKT